MLYKLLFSTICGVRARVKHSSDRPSGRPRPPMRRHFDPNDRCYRCNQRGHYAYDCDKYAGGGGGEGGRGGGGKSRRLMLGSCYSFDFL